MRAHSSEIVDSNILGLTGSSPVFFWEKGLNQIQPLYKHEGCAKEEDLNYLASEADVV